MAKTYSEVIKIDSSAAAPLYVSSSVATPVHVSASTSIANPLVVTFATTAVQTVTASQANPLSITGSVALLDSYLTSVISDVVEVTASSANPVYMSASQENPVSVAVKFVDEDGVAYGIEKNTGGHPEFVALPYGWQVAEGRQAYHTASFIEGICENISNSLVTVWNSASAAYPTYIVPPSGGIQMQVRSTHIADSASGDTAVHAGLGVQRVCIHYLDKDLVQHTEKVYLSGTTYCPTVATDIRRIQQMHTYEVGHSGSAVGTILLRNIEDTQTYSMINPQRNNSRIAFWTVPRYHTMYITDWHVSAGNAQAGPSSYDRAVQFTLASTSTREGTRAENIFMIKDTLIVKGGAAQGRFSVPIKIPEMTDIRVQAVTDATTPTATGSVAINGWHELQDDQRGL